MKLKLQYSVAGVLASLMVHPAMAQTPQSDDQSARTIEEVVVTAQRFEETAQKTPLIITAIAADDLAGVSDVRQLQTLTPGVQIGQAGSSAQTFIRGVGSFNVTGNSESAVAYNADGVTMYSTSMITPMMYDLQRIEVLKGPQGTLYGRNATGGAINLLTKGAALGDTAEGYIEGEAGNFNLWRVTGAVNLPVTDTLAVRFAGNHTEHDGYLSDGTEDQNVTAGRVRVLWQASTNITVQAGLDGSIQDAVGGGSTLNPNTTGEKFVGGTDPIANQGMSSLTSAPPTNPYFEDNQWSAFAQVDVDLGGGRTLTLLPGYRYEDRDLQNYSPGFEQNEAIENKQTSFEVRLAQQSDRYRWVLGAYYFNIDQAQFNGVRNEGLGQNIHVNLDWNTRSYAIFGETTFSVTDQLRLIGGVRYTEDENSSRGQQNNIFVPGGHTVAFNPAVDSGDYFVDLSDSGNATSWKVGLEYDLAPESLLFATISRGYKGGGNYVDRPGQATLYRPEYLTAYTLGSRNRFLGNSLQVNGELFYWKYEDQQIPGLAFNTVPEVILRTINAEEATMYGANIDIVWRATANDTFNFAAEYLHSEYNKFVRETPTPFVLMPTACRVGPGSLPFLSAVDCSGLVAQRAPEWSLQASYEHRFDLGDAGELTGNVGVAYATERYMTIAYTPEVLQKGVALYDATLTYRSPNSDTTVTGWIKNITDERVMSGGDQIFSGLFRATVLPPRTYGVSIRRSF